jgi:hypothetical protein
MPRGKTTTTTGTKTRLETQRVTSLEPRAGKQLTSLEEAVVRMHHGVSVRPDAGLPTNGVTDELMSKLLDIEVRAFEETGRIDDLDDIPAGETPSSERVSRIVSELKRKS